MSTISEDSTTRLSKIVAGDSIMAPSVAISRTIEALDSGQRLRVFGEVAWEDILATSELELQSISGKTSKHLKSEQSQKLSHFLMLFLSAK